MILRSYPRSFRRMLVIGFGLVVIPSAIGLIGSAISVTQLATRGERAVVEAARATQTARRLGEALSELERNARQFAILGDTEVLEAYDGNRRRLSSAAEDFLATNPDLLQRAQVQRIMTLETEVEATLQQRQVDASLDAALDKLGHMSALARDLQQRVSESVERDAAELKSEAARSRTIALVQVVALLPMIGILVVGFTVLIARPIRELDTAIRRLGRGQFAEPVRVRGPDDLEDLGRRLDWMRTELVGLEQEKNRFLREISHALKTPLTALREGTALLHEGDLGQLTGEQRAVTEILYRQTLELQRLIQDLLQYGAAQVGRTALAPVTADLRALVEGVVERHRLVIQSRGITVHVAAEPIAVRVDADKFRTILDNLLSNAVKFSPDRSHIRIAARRHDGAVVLDVADEGPGIDAADAVRIFEPFVQGRALPSGTIPGTGIGLSLVREHARAHGGKVELVESPAGAWFRVTLMESAT
jgi:two-component system sensor histidine kinase GlrK